MYSRKECPLCAVKLSSMRVLRPDTAFDGMIQTIFPPQVRAMPLVRREANLDRKIQLSHNEEEREDEYVGLDDEMSPRKGAGPLIFVPLLQQMSDEPPDSGKRGTPSKRGRGIKGTSTTPPVLPPASSAAPAASPLPQHLSPTPALAVPEKSTGIAISPASVTSKMQNPVDKQQKSGPKRMRAKRNPDADVCSLRNALVPSHNPNLFFPENCFDSEVRPGHGPHCCASVPRYPR
jgi:hypothetical protein